MRITSVCRQHDLMMVNISVPDDVAASPTQGATS